MVQSCRNVLCRPRSDHDKRMCPDCCKVAGGCKGLKSHQLEEASSRTVGDSIPEPYPTSVPPEVVSTEPEAMGQAQPEAVGQAQPEAMGQAQPEAMGKALPEAMGQAQPEVVSTAMDVDGKPRGKHIADESPNTLHCHESSKEHNDDPSHNLRMRRKLHY
ncbi:hypothetical protein CYMTET_44760 [Cymbomonas tetramitiformis]|uniref:Uncharacterized protein n=1 Tax=Cymbomonas tetramitiformis TaxID=36881 RepID=A0AAE0C0S2_9CHLO|nr:hypothetical protein CYMTET_44760 [Cymbomonas tetramitiformis]